MVVSTIEHIGLPVYGQVGFDADGDVKAIEELRRTLKPGGYLIITTPFAGGSLGSFLVRGSMTSRGLNCLRGVSGCC
jgi:SAM-dependent methyltransferase